jgi:aminoglycoside phosphotransferase (APT) family kinase protein
MVSHWVKPIIKQHFGTKLLTATRMPFGHSSSEVYDVVLPQRQVIVKLNREATALEGIQKNLTILAELGLPVSKVLYADMSRTEFPVAYVVLGRIPGRDLRYELDAMTKAQMTTLAEQLVTFQRQVMSLPRGRGFGWAPLGETAPFASWADIVQRDLKRGKEVLEREGQDNLYKSVEIISEQLSDYFVNVQPICFLDDITTKNVIVQNGQLSGLVDFDVVCYGDPLFWLALTQTAVAADVGASGQFYVDELLRFWNPNATEKQVIEFYTLLHTMDFVAFAVRTNDLALRERLLEWMTRLMK